MSDESESRSNGGDPPEEEASEIQNSLELVHRAQDGDLAAFDTLFGRYFLRVRKIVRARLGARLRRDLDSEDIVQEAMVEAIRSFHDFRIENRQGLIALFVVIVENRIRANARRTSAQKRDRNREITLAHLRDSIATGSIDFSPADDGPLPPDLVAEAELRLKLLDAMELLDLRDRESIKLRNFQNKSWEEVAEAIGAPTANAARMTHARALMKLRDELGGVDGFTTGL